MNEELQERILELLNDMVMTDEEVQELLDSIFKE